MKTNKQTQGIIPKTIGKIKNFFGSQKKKVLKAVDKNPNRSFYVALSILVILIVISNVLGSTQPETTTQTQQAKKVELYTIGKAPRVEVLGKVEKSGVITITALAPGVVSSINRREGSAVRKGETLIGLASNYQGGNASSLQRQLAAAQYKNTNDTYDLQKELIGKQRELAEKGDIQADEMRNIADKSLGETRDLITLNTEIIATLDANIADLEATNVGGANDDLIFSTKSLKSQFLAGNLAAKQGIRMAEYSAAGDTAAAQMSDLGRDLALKQLDFQEKMLDLSKEISGIQLKISQVVEAMMYPAAPFAGVVERVLVKRGQAVNPGTPLAILSGEGKGQTSVVVAYVSAEMARTISKLEESVISISGMESFSAQPTYVSGAPVQGSLYGVYFTIPDEYVDKVSDGSFITIELPVGYFDTATSVPFVPIDAIYQTKEKNYLFVVDGDKAKSLEVELGQVMGSLVEITKGIDSSARVILNRTVISGDMITEQ